MLALLLLLISAPSALDDYEIIENVLRAGALLRTCESARSSDKRLFPVLVSRLRDDHLPNPDRSASGIRVLQHQGFSRQFLVQPDQTKPRDAKLIHTAGGI